MRNFFHVRIETYACVRNNAPTVFRTVPRMAILRRVGPGIGFEFSIVDSYTSAAIDVDEYAG